MISSVIGHNHSHWVGCMYSTLLASLHDGASIKGAVESLPPAEDLASGAFLGMEIARPAPGHHRDSFIGRLSPLVAIHERMVANAVTTGLHLALDAAGRERVTRTVERVGLVRRPLSNTLTITVCTDKHSHNADQLWCSVSIDLDRPTARVALQYGPRLPKGILKVVSTRTQVVRANGYEELALQVGGRIQKALSAFSPEEFPASGSRGEGIHGTRGTHAIAILF